MNVTGISEEKGKLLLDRLKRGCCCLYCFEGGLARDAVLLRKAQIDSPCNLNFRTHRDRDRERDRDRKDKDRERRSKLGSYTVARSRPPYINGLLVTHASRYPLVQTKSLHAFDNQLS